ncbi:HIT family protein [Actinoplanes sichuanensis]|uniref:HIT family protein n=1 Tax=Actinoplanes sichuanensis TaxID=512349 RepID=A0ABW4AT83_9ACTN|nr:HIT domain-containing protein [Actinoplanes sichuanensis]
MPCIFCELLAADGPATWIAREEGAAAFLTLPRSALAPGHTLVVPTEHAVGVQDVSAAGLTATMALVQRVARGMAQGLGAAGVNVLNASGPGSEQSVAHLHFHVVPRWLDDGFTTWPSGRSRREGVGDPGMELAVAVAAIRADDDGIGHRSDSDLNEDRPD